MQNVHEGWDIFIEQVEKDLVILNRQADLSEDAKARLLEKQAYRDFINDCKANRNKYASPNEYLAHRYDPYATKRSQFIGAALNRNKAKACKGTTGDYTAYETVAAEMKALQSVRSKTTTDSALELDIRTKLIKRLESVAEESRLSGDPPSFEGNPESPEQFLNRLERDSIAAMARRSSTSAEYLNTTIDLVRLEAQKRGILDSKNPAEFNNLATWVETNLITPRLPMNSQNLKEIAALRLEVKQLRAAAAKLVPVPAPPPHSRLLRQHKGWNKRLILHRVIRN